MSDAAAQLLRSVVYGEPEADLHDLAETYHEASKLHPALGRRQADGIARLAESALLHEACRRTPRRNRQLPSVPLVPSAPPDASLWSALHERRSRPPRRGGTLQLPTLATLLAGACGPSGDGLRTAPSGGALYPLELYVVARQVEELADGVYHVDPGRRLLEVVSERPASDLLLAATPMPELVAEATAVVFVTAVFWRTRFKYGLRGYRFALLEAGHVVQNLLLVATALRVSALPLGGFYEAFTDDLLGVDGVDESTVHAVVLGGDGG